MALATLDDLKLYLWINDTGWNPELVTWDEDNWDIAYDNTTQDGLLQILLDWAIAFVESYTGRTFDSDEYEEYIDGNAQREIILDHYPVTELTSIEYDNWTLSTPDREDVDVDSYKLIPKSGRILLTFCLIRGFQNYKVTYTAGYATAPDDLKMATLKLAATYYNNTKSDWIKSESVSWDELVYDTKEVPSDILIILNLFRNV